MSVTIDLKDADATLALGRELALFVKPGDVLALHGDLGAGKTTLARGLLRALMRDEALDVPSPSFALVQAYEAPRFPVAHYDFYRLSSPAEALETGFQDRPEGEVSIVEWPERLGSEMPAGRLDVTLDFSGEGRRAVLEGRGGWTARLFRFAGARGFLAREGWGGAHRRPLDVDASSRRYERVALGGRHLILMDMPAMPDGPPVRDGRPYSAIVHLAEDIRAVVAINNALRTAGFSAPEVYACDLRQGFALTDDFGDRVFGRMIAERADMGEPFMAAVTVLAEMAGRDWPAELPLPDGAVCRLSRYDREALEMEASLLLDWYWPLLKGGPVPEAARGEYEAAWRQVLPLALPERPVLVLRDFHSPNLMWLPEREGTARVGLIDTQDALLGHPAYDLASMLQDARVDIVEQTADDLFDYYCALRAVDEPGFDRAAFAAGFAVLGAQRASKILGIFARLWKRDGKPGYLRHLPRVSRLLERNLRHPALAPVAAWFERHLPEVERRRAERLAA